MTEVKTDPDSESTAGHEETGKEPDGHPAETAETEQQAKEPKADKPAKEPKAEKPAKKAKATSVPGGLLRRLGLTDPLRTTAVVLTLVAAIAAAWFGWSWHSASNDGSLSYARLRDQVLQTGEQAVVNLNTLDYRNVEAGLKAWQDSSTAQLYDQIVQGRAQLEQEVQKGKTTSTAKVLESALTELDAHAGKAGLIVAIRVTTTPGDGKPTVRISRLIGQLTKTSSGWKLSALGQAPTGN